jgi:hypothetical protein
MPDPSAAEQAELFPLLDAVPDPRPLEPATRVTLLDPVYNEVMQANGGTTWHTAGPEATLLWEATLETFAQGIWAATIVTAQAVCERTLGSLIHFRYALNPPSKKELRANAGLGEYIDFCQKRDLISIALADSLRHVAEARKPFGHWKTFDHPRSLERIGYNGHTTGHHWQEAQDIYVAKTALLCAQTAIRVHFGDLLNEPPAQPNHHP